MNRIGEKHTTKEGYEVEIIEYFRWNNCTIQFEDYNVYKNIRYSHIKNGEIRNPYHLSVHEIGYFGVGNYKAKINGKTTKHYGRWKAILNRCYSKNYHLKKPTYEDCLVDEYWHNFQNFAKWYEENYNPEIMKGWNLDKDILIKGNKVYSPETCCFVPDEINILFTKRQNKRGNCPIGVSLTPSKKYVAYISIDAKRLHLGTFDTSEEAFEIYKDAKEKHIKEIAIKWKSKITFKVYQALMNYQVEITD